MEEIETNTEEFVDEEAEDIIPFRYSITSYGADYPLDSLVKRMNNASIYIPTFQRGYVWKLREASRFIESLLLGLPVPGIVLARERETQKLLVIDGQQRLRTIQYFYNGIFQPNEKEFALDGISSSFNGSTYKLLSDEDRIRLDDSIIPATIVRQDEPSDDESSIYQIFERLNTGGVKLQPQEIRACIYHGELNELIKQLNSNSAWRNIYGSIDPRMKDQEMILRFLALHFESQEYKKPLKGFLNNFMGVNRHLRVHTNEQISMAFTSAIEVCFRCLGDRAFKPRKQINAAIFDSVMVGISSRLRNGEITDNYSIAVQYEKLLSNQKYLSATLNTARTTEVAIVEERLREAISAFADVA